MLNLHKKQLLLELHCIDVIHFHQCVPSMLGWFCILYMHNHEIRQVHQKPIQNFYSFFMPIVFTINKLMYELWRLEKLITTLKKYVYFELSKFWSFCIIKWEISTFFWTNFKLGPKYKIISNFFSPFQCLFKVSP